MHQGGRSGRTERISPSVRMGRMGHRRGMELVYRDVPGARTDLTGEYGRACEEGHHD